MPPKHEANHYYIHCVMATTSNLVLGCFPALIGCRSKTKDNIMYKHGQLYVSDWILFT